ncbi:ABC transporter substrate-binding protein [Mycoplasmopsis ciconiae]|uniref:ABC transporter substrate-binding protein n=1 Tax=Mycoplasmopsis ciconiae TaxID=561067 RepID=A0ABU7MNN3_9BACT|nr:ABC transporter substrate-binding protein [Mycoplasmopsis ciconiae]
MKNKLFKYIAVLGSFSLAPLSVVACVSNQSGTSLSKNYDFGLAADPLNNLNYVKYRSVDRVLPSLVEPFLKTGPTSSLKSIIPTGALNLVLLDTPNQVKSANFDEIYQSQKNSLKNERGYGAVSSAFYSIDNFGLLGGLARSTEGGDATRSSGMYGFRNPVNTNNYSAFTGVMNNSKNFWSNGQVVTAEDIRSYFQYILDINTGSQNTDKVIKYGIRQSEEFVNAQKNYIKKFNKVYKNPWGLYDYQKAPWDVDGTEFIQVPTQNVWQSQTFDENNQPIDVAEVEAIKKAAKEFGLYTGQLFLDFSIDEINNNLKNNPDFDINLDQQPFKIEKKGKIYDIVLIKNPYVNPYQEYIFTNGEITSEIKSLSYDRFSFTMIFDSNKTPNLSYLVFNIASNIFPINRSYVENQAGGIDEYGSQPDKFLTTGAFYVKPGDVVFGPQGKIVLTKNPDYYDADNTISNKIQIFFSTDRTVNSTLFDDGYISQTQIPANKINQYWSDPVGKTFLNKTYGYGTIGYGFNLDNQTKANSYLQDQDLRNAIYFSINREDLLRSVGWDFSFPVNTWTAYGQSKLSDGRNLENFFDGSEAKAKNDKSYPIQNNDYIVKLAKVFKFEKTQRGDITYDIETAKFYLDRFKAKHPELKESGITLKFLNNSTDEQKKAGQYLRQQLKVVTDDFIKIDIKSLPENTFVEFMEKGDFDIVYQNYDRIGGNGPQDYVAAFFKSDEIDKFTQKTIGFKDNPSGSYTYASYLIDIFMENMENAQVGNYSLVIQEYISAINAAIEALGLTEELKKSNVNPNYFEKTLFSKNHANQIREYILANYPKLNAKVLNNVFVSDILDSLTTDEVNLKVSKLKHAVASYFNNNFSLEELSKLSEQTRNRLNISQRNWNQFIDLAFIRDDEDINKYTARLNKFFSYNFSEEQKEAGWNDEQVFVFIGDLEKIVRDGGFVIPLMEVDTNWEVTKVGGVSSLFRFSLQYAYDYTNPPRSGLPRKREG